MDMIVITQLYCQLYITYQLHVSANTIFVHHRVGYNYRRKLHNICNMIQYNHQCGVRRGGQDSVANEISSPSTYTNTDGYTVSYYILRSFFR